MASGVCAPIQSSGPDPAGQGSGNLTGSANGSNGQFDAALRSASDSANPTGGAPATTSAQPSRFGDGATGGGRIGPDQGGSPPGNGAVGTQPDTATGNNTGTGQPPATTPGTIDIAALQANAPSLDTTTSSNLASIVNGTATPDQTTAGVQGLTDYLVSLAPTAATTDVAAATNAMGEVMAGLRIARTDEANPLARLLVNEGTIDFRNATNQPIANADSADLYGGSPQLLGQWADTVGTQDSANYLTDFLSYLSSTDLTLS